MLSVYYLGLADWNVRAYDKDNIAIADDYTGIFDPNGVFDHFSAISNPYRLGEYIIQLSEVTSSVHVVPELASMLLFGTGLAGAFIRKRFTV